MSSPSHEEHDDNDNKSKEDLDAFLIEVESKLRGPFSSLVLSDTAMRSSSPREYLNMIRRILPKMDKVVKLRLCVGLLGLEPLKETDDVVYDILTKLQEAPVHEEWVRVVAGVCRGILFTGDGSRESCRGDEARSLLAKTCQNILAQADDDRGDDSTRVQDLDPLFAPFYYSLLDTDVLKDVLPDCLSNPHFVVNRDADILQEDDKLEKVKIQEEARALSTPRSSQSESTSASVSLEPVIMPGMRSIASSSLSRPKATATKSSMFIQSKRPATGNSGGRQLVANARKTPIHARKAGAAQSLLAKGRKLGKLSAGVQSGGVPSSATGARGRTMKYGNSRSKMKMIDVSEVKGLQERDSRVTDEGTKEDKKSARKRKILETAAAKGLVSEAKLKKAKMSGTETPAMEEKEIEKKESVPDSGPSVDARRIPASASSVANGPSDRSAQIKTPDGGDAQPSSQAPSNEKQDWRLLLQKANKLSAEDGFRVKAFFTDRFNPTPDVPVYKMKLNEEKMIDPETNGMVKETLYLELNYTTYGFKKLRKRKKYDT